MSNFIKRREPASKVLAELIRGCESVGTPVSIHENHSTFGSIEWDCKAVGVILLIDIDLYECVDELFNDIMAKHTTGSVAPKCKWVWDSFDDSKTTGFYIDFGCKYVDRFWGLINKQSVLNKPAGTPE